MPLVRDFDAIVIGAGAAGLFAAGIAGQRGLRVLLLDHAPKVAEKVRISGGGRCNFTNLNCAPENFLSENPAFCRSALARYRPADFIALVLRHGIPFHEKHRGQLFCDGPSDAVIAMLLSECAAGRVERWQPCKVLDVRHSERGFELDTAGGGARAPRLAVATGGLSIPKLGASDFGHRLARQFGHRLVEARPGLVPLTFDAADWAAFTPLAGLSVEVGLAAGSGKARARFVEDLLFTHRGLSGPAVLQASSYWREGDELRIDLAPGQALAEALRAAKQASRRQLGNQLALQLPQRLGDAWLQRLGLDAAVAMPQVRDRDLARLAESLHHWPLRPNGSEGWRKAEVTVGGVDTRDLHSHDLQSRLVPGLHFIGEVVDVTGWLGGYNFQWAWASAAACATALPVARSSGAGVAVSG
jgi:predicted Rossmann fold flavoprotein